MGDISKFIPLGEVVVDAEYGLSIPSSDEGTVSILGMQNIRDGKICAKDCARVNVPTHIAEKFRVRKGDLLFNRTNSAALVGKSAVAGADMDCVFASYLVRFKLDDSRVRPAYIGYYLNTDISIRRLRELATPGVSQYNINPTTLRRHFRVWIPPLDYQDMCLSVLSTWDQAIDQTERLIAANRRRKHALMQQFFTSKRRLKRSSLVSLKCIYLGDVFMERNENNRSDLPLASITADRGVIPREDLDKKDTSNEDKRLYKRIAPGDIGYNTMRMWQGVSALSTIEGIVSPAYTICIPQKEINPVFAAHLFKFPPIVHLFHRHSQGLVDDTLNLKYTNFAKIKVEVPPLDEQKLIGSCLTCCDQEIRQLADQMKALNAQRQGLMHQLLTGTVRIGAL